VRCAQHEQALAARADVEATGDRVFPELGLSCVPGAQGKRIATVERDRNLPAPIELRRSGRMPEARLEAPAQWNAASEALDPARELAKGAEAARCGQGHGVGHTDLTGARGEGGLEDVRLREIAARRLERDVRSQFETPTVRRVEQRPEHARGVEVGQAEPVDRSVFRGERDRPAVPDRGVVGDRRVAVGTFRRGHSRRQIPALGDSYPWRTGRLSRLLALLAFSTAAALGLFTPRELA
jgi:hypothetical protein